MADDELPPANLILQALHAIRAAAEKTNDRIDGTNRRLDDLVGEVKKTNLRLDATNERIDTLREFTVSGLTTLNQKVDNLATKVDTLGSELHQLNDRFENFLTGEGARLVRRVDSLEEEMRRIAAKVDH